MLGATLSERLLARDGLEASDRETLLRVARRLQCAGGTTSALLAGRHLAIAGEPGPDGAGGLLEAAAAALGARVSRIAPDLLLGGHPAGAIAAARLLARLYDAVDCPGDCAGRALELQRQAGVPVFVALAGARHPVRMLIPALPELDAGTAALRLVQAVLMESLA